jgi:GT2 family glycosyltransferase
MNLNNYHRYIKNKKVTKSNDLIICIPTYNSFQLTKSTIDTFYSQSFKDFDLIIIGESGDIEKLNNVFPSINFILTNENYGGTANKLIGMYLAIEMNYEYCMINDNDSYLLNNDGLEILMKNIRNNNCMAVRASHSSNYDPNKPDIYFSKEPFCVFHCCILKTEILKNIKLPNQNYFIIHDDISFLCNFYEKYQILTNQIVNYYHPLKISFYKFENFYKFFFIRGTLLGLKIE